MVPAGPETTANAEQWLQQGEQHMAARQVREALEAFDCAEKLGADPDHCSGARWIAWMLLGDFERAWAESDAIRARKAPDPHRFWDGEPLEGKRVIVRCLHGLGDAVQMLRYAPRLAASARSVVYEVPPRMVWLASFFRGMGEVVTWGEGAPAVPPEWDVQVEVMELPYLFRTTLDALPMETKYLKLSPELVGYGAEQMGPSRRPRVGVVWACGDWNPTRNVPCEAVKRLVSHREFDFWSLQGGEQARECGALGMRDAAAVCGNGLVQLAVAIANVDLVITADTLAAHLAGAMGKPAWVMLQYAADWRWMLDREDSPWYPGLRLFRQTFPGDWEGVINRVNHSFQEWEAPRGFTLVRWKP